ncbi:MAG: hypothetical protein CM1200mP25_2390 [Acidobacteriota bacterium]|nr:MAG: hypothetical protein CM1200mP25_2390 [Acidobacteriota bacterium]
MDFQVGLKETVAWYKENEWWWHSIKHDSTEFQAYYDKQYARIPNSLEQRINKGSRCCTGHQDQSTHQQ